MLINAMLNILFELIVDIFTEAFIGVDLDLVIFWYTETIGNSQ